MWWNFFKIPLCSITALIDSELVNFKAGSRYYNITNNTQFDQVGTQLTIKPVSLNGSLPLFSSAPSTGIQTQQLLISSAGATTTTLNSTTIFCSNYNTTSATGTTEFSLNTTTGIIAIGGNLTTGRIEFGTSSSKNYVNGVMKFF